MMDGSQSQYGGTESPSEAVVRALSAELETAAENVQPLYDAIDPDALDALFDDRSTDWIVRFEHAGHRIAAHSSGEIRIEHVQSDG